MKGATGSGLEPNPWAWKDGATAMRVGKGMPLLLSERSGSVGEDAEVAASRAFSQNRPASLVMHLLAHAHAHNTRQDAYLRMKVTTSKTNLPVQSQYNWQDPSASQP